MSHLHVATAFQFLILTFILEVVGKSIDWVAKLPGLNLHVVLRRVGAVG